MSGDRIRERRRILNWTPTQLGRRVRMTADDVTDVEAGRRKLTQAEVERFGRAMGCHWRALTEPGEDPPAVIPKTHTQI